MLNLQEYSIRVSTMRRTTYFTFLGATLVSLLVCSVVSDCRDAAHTCCAGRNASCVSKGWRSDRSFGTCYCDQACVGTVDCCHDYHTACPAVSCVVSEWSEWSGCLEPCRATVRRRTRTVLQDRVNAGKPCPHLEEHAGCARYWTQQGHCLSALVPALITTGGYGNARKKRHIPDSNDTIGYCVQFELSSMTKGCQHNGGPHTRWMRHLRGGLHVCVECQPPALAAGHRYCAGDGRTDSEEDGRQPLHWQAVGNPQCRGAWRPVRRLEACSCPTDLTFLFI
ncbi:somatomedin-B and thrombospondin type-1 domain-containing protein [Dunckerocampus dactyliophorus]|uniref:somatomedin-B and thrombospondin type-1 domain-containing protein n=1 Tax=Dunckerocampus dactyliophorus TaxID=161453 RepID=UPI0024057C9C|nr:somatomedin-B and thrombospondin type-1 domain-containing protein [Dunckerocampus dactyliophorus]